MPAFQSCHFAACQNEKMSDTNALTECFRDTLRQLKEDRELAEVCAESVTGLLNQRWGLDELKQSADSDNTESAMMVRVVTT